MAEEEAKLKKEEEELEKKIEEIKAKRMELKSKRKPLAAHIKKLTRTWASNDAKSVMIFFANFGCCLTRFMCD